MFSKYFRLSLLVVFSLQIGCGLKTGEKVKEPEAVTFSGASCIKGSVENFKKFIAGDASDEEVGSAIECLQEAIEAFKDNVRGADHSKYTPAELSNFIFRKFLKSENDISPELLTQLVKLKTLFAGGDNNFITRPELDGLVSVLARLKPELVRLNPHIKVYLSKWQPGNEDKEAQLAKFEAARSALKTALNRLGQLFAATHRGLEVTDLLKLIGEAAKLGATPDSQSTLPDMLVKAEALVVKLKLNLIGGTTEIKGTEWIGLLDLAAEGVAQSLRLQYFLLPLTPEQSNEKLDVYRSVVTDVTRLIPDILRGHASAITNSQIYEIIDSAKPLMPMLAGLSPEFVDQIGKLKLVILGNINTTYMAWSIADFSSLNMKLPELFEIAKISLASLKYYKIDGLGYRAGTLKHEEFLQAELNLNGAIKKLTEKVLYSYDLEGLKQIVIGVKAIAGDTFKLPDDLEAFFKLVYAAKVTVTGEPGTHLSVKNIQQLLNVGVRLYGNAVELANFVLPFKTNEPEMTMNLGPWILKIRDSLLYELNLKDSHEITTAELTNLVLAAQDSKFLTTAIQKESLELFLNAVWSRVLTKPEDRLGVPGDTRPPKGSLTSFNEEALTNAATEIQLWIENQRTIFQIFSEKAEYTKEELVEVLRSRVGEASTLSQPARLSLVELYKVVSARGMMNFNPQGFLKILSGDAGLYHLRDLTASNLAKTAARILTRSFSGDLGKISDYAGVTQAEAQDGFDQFKALLFDLGILDRSDVGFIASRFTEANLFLSVSNGDDYASFEELHHIILHIQSGLARATAMQERMMAACVRERAPIVIKSVLNQNCLMDFFLSENDAFLDLPKFLQLKTELINGQAKYKPEDNKKYYLSLLLAAGYIPDETVPVDQRTVELGKASLFPHVVQYVEMIFSTYESDRSGTLEKEEALGAFPIFKNLLAFLTKDIKQVQPEDLPGVFIYLIKYKKPPTSLGDKLKFITFIKDKEQKDWEIHSTRHDLGDVFNFIAAASKPKPAPAAGGEAAPEPSAQPQPAPNP